jgi:DNA-binding MarR family transcriptional regulator
VSTLRRVEGRPTWLLGRANARAQVLLAEAFASAGMRGYHFRVLAALEEHGPASQADLSRATGIDTSDVVAAVSHLVSTGLARRERDGKDRRRNAISITKAGLIEVDRVGGAVDRVQDIVMEQLSDNERATLLRLLAKLS